MTTDRFKEFVADTEAAAIEKAVTHYGVDSAQLEVRVLSEKLEVSGLAGRALVLAAGPGGAPTGAPERSEAPRGRRERGRPERGGRERGGRDRGGRDERSNGRGARDARPPREEVAREQAPLSIETGELGEVGRFVEHVVRAIAKGGAIRIEETQSGDEAQISIKGSGANELARNPGLGAALSHLADRVAENLASEDATAYVELGERADRERERDADAPSDPRLEALARDRAEAVRSSGEPALLDPMSSRDRFIVHNTVKELDGVSSESVGDGPDKRVKIFPA
jgi:predicted RNA-binding protein Jag